MKIINISMVVAGACLLAFPSRGQYAADAFRFSEITQTGTARFQGVGGIMPRWVVMPALLAAIRPV